MIRMYSEISIGIYLGSMDELYCVMNLGGKYIYIYILRYRKYIDILAHIHLAFTYSYTYLFNIFGSFRE